MLPVRAWRKRARARPRRLLHRLADLDRTSAFYRIAERHQHARVSRRLLALAVVVLVAVLATRAAGAAPAPQAPQPVAVPSDCDGELDCDDGGDRADDTDPDSANADSPELVGVMPQIVTRRAAGAGARTNGPCRCPSSLPLAIPEVAAAAVRAAGLDRDPVPGWSTRTRLAGLVPMFSARYGRNLTWKDVDDPTLGYTNMYDLRATWHLERLLFDQNELRIAAIDVGRRREKRRVEMLAVHTYLSWLQLPRESPRAILLASDLDAITDGWFSQALAKRGKP